MVIIDSTGKRLQAEAEEAVFIGKCDFICGSSDRVRNTEESRSFPGRHSVLLVPDVSRGSHVILAP